MTDVARPAPGQRPEVYVDIHHPDFGKNHYETYDELRPRCPVAWSTAGTGFWLTTDYKSTFDATRDDDVFISSLGAGIPRVDGATDALTQVLPPIHTDPPVTAEMRKLTLKHLSPGEADRLEPEIRAIATELIDEFIERGEADIVRELTTPLPARVILRLLNFDENKWPEWVEIIHSIIHGEEGGMERSVAEAAVQAAIGSEMARRAQFSPPDDDLVGTILSGTALGKPLTIEEKFGYILLLLFGGMDTTSGLTGNTLIQLSEEPSLKTQLIDRPDLMRSATEEFLRHSTPTLGLARVVSRDTEFHGQQLKEGERVLLTWAAANRDPTVFSCPAEIDLERQPNRHLAFGVGQHRCLGSNLARTMFRVMVSEILARLPDFTVVETVRFKNAGSVYAPRSLRIRFTPGTRS
jgi:cytochrome P450